MKNKAKSNVLESLKAPKRVSNGIIKSRPVVKPVPKQGDIYISRTTTYSSVLKRVKDFLLKQDLKHCTLHGLGARILNATQFALMAKKEMSKFGTCQFEISTSTVNTADDFIPDDEDEDKKATARELSAIHIKLIFKK